MNRKVQEMKHFALPRVLKGIAAVLVMFVCTIIVWDLLKRAMIRTSDANVYIGIASLSYDPEADLVTLERRPDRIIPGEVYSEMIGGGREPCVVRRSILTQPNETGLFQARLQRYFTPNCKPKAGVYRIMSVNIFRIEGVEKIHSVQSEPFEITPEQAARFR